MILKRNVSVFFILLIICSVPSAFAASGDAAGGNGVHLDYDEEHVDEEHVDEEHVDFKEIDFDSLDEPLQFRWALWLNNVGKIEKESGTYELDFWYIVESDDVNFLETGAPPIGFVNGKSVKTDSEYIEESYYETRVRGIFFNVLDFREYPFEKIQLNVEIEPDMPYHLENAVFTVDEELSGIDDKVNVVGWELKDASFEVNVHEYEGWHNFERFVVTFPLERSITGALLKTFLPVSIITGVSLLIFYIPGNFSSRIYLTAPLLLALVFLHRASLGELPTLSYMTIFDKVMVIYYALFANSITSLAIQMRLHHNGSDDKHIRKVNRIMIYFIPIIVVIIAIVLLSL